MKLFGYDIYLSFDNEWKQLEILWNKDVHYNWYSFTFIRFCWSFSFRKNKEELRKNIGSKMKISDFPKTYGQIIFGLLGLDFILTITKYWDED